MSHEMNKHMSPVVNKNSSSDDLAGLIKNMNLGRKYKKSAKTLSGISKSNKKPRINPFTGLPFRNQSQVNKGGSRRRRITHKKRKSHRKSKRVHHTRRKHTRRHHHHSRRRHRHHRR
jgi:hypothetical protein